MKRLLLVAIATAAAVLAVPAAAWADTSEVSAAGCLAQGGHVYRPAGTEIVVRQGFFFKNIGLTKDFILDQSTTVSVNGGTAVDVSAQYLSPFVESDFWFTRVFYPTGVTLATGESMTFQMVVTLSHVSVDGVSFENGEFGKPVFFNGRFFDVTCTVTGF
jgi:hypothetical protein